MRNHQTSAKNAAPPAASKNNNHYLKIAGILTLLSALFTGFYLRSIRSNSEPSPSELAKFPLAKYPIAVKIGMGEFNVLMGNRKEGRKFNSFVMFNALDPGAGCSICPYDIDLYN